MTLISVVERRVEGVRVPSFMSFVGFFERGVKTCKLPPTTLVKVFDRTVWLRNDEWHFFTLGRKRSHLDSLTRWVERKDS